MKTEKFSIKKSFDGKHIEIEDISSMKSFSLKLRTNSQTDMYMDAFKSNKRCTDFLFNTIFSISVMSIQNVAFLRYLNEFMYHFVETYDKILNKSDMDEFDNMALVSAMEQYKAEFEEKLKDDKKKSNDAE